MIRGGGGLFVFEDQNNAKVYIEKKREIHKEHDDALKSARFGNSLYGYATKTTIVYCYPC